MTLVLPQGSYLAILVFSLLGLAGLDFRFKMAFFLEPVRSLISTVPVFLLLLVWDISGILLGIFFIGDSNLLTGVILAPELPLEEIFFLALLCYSTLILFLAAQKLTLKRGKQ